MPCSADSPGSLDTPASLCWLDEHSHARGRVPEQRLGGRHLLRRDAAPLPARPARRRPGRRRGARRDPRHPLDQDDGQGLRHRPGHLDGRPDDARGRDTPGKVRALVRQGGAAPTRPTRPARRPRRSASTPTWSPTAKEALGDSGVKVAAVATAFPSGRAALDVKLADTQDAVEAGADEIDMVIDRGAFLVRPLPGGLRGDRRGQGGLRQADGRARTSRSSSRPASCQTYDNVRRASLAGDAGRRRLHQDLHRQGAAGRHAAGHPGHARGGPRLPRGRPASRSA